MAESVAFSVNADRKTLYNQVVPQIEALVSGEIDVTANLANTAAVLKEVFGFFWVGFYLKKQSHLVLGPFQGPVACTRIEPEQGVCGHAYSTRQVVVVPDVDLFPGHIACSSASLSEIVVPIFNNDGGVFGVLDVDSNKLSDFDQTDSEGLSRVVRIIERSIVSDLL